MPIDRKKFFDAVRVRPFGGALTLPAVSNINAIMDEWERRNLADLRWLAYMFATVMAECGRNMAPIAEFGKGRGHPYGNPINGKVYYGRGYVQLTWDYNYKKMGDLLGVDLLGNPEKALQPKIASQILFEGMIRGSFTGKKLSDFFNAQKTDWSNARRIINALDRAGEIAGYGKQFYAALTGAGVIAAVKEKAATPEGATGGTVAAGGAVVATIEASQGASVGEVVLILACAALAAFILYAIIKKVRGS